MSLQNVIGRRANPTAARDLISRLKDAPLDGILYLGYPILLSREGGLVVDALLATRQTGIVAIHFAAERDLDADEFEVHLDNMYVALESQLKSQPRLRSGRNGLMVPLSVRALLPTNSRLSGNRPEVVSAESLLKDLLKLHGVTPDVFALVMEVIEGMANIKPAEKRTNVLRADSMGGKMKQIEDKTAHFDAWQRQAAIELPDGPQRIRGLAGSGKTVILAHKAAYLHGSFPDWDIAVTYYSRSLGPQFKDLIRGFFITQFRREPNWEKLKVLHAWGGPRRNGLYSEVAGAYGLPCRDYGYGKRQWGRDSAFEGVCEEALRGLEERGAKPLYDAVLIDEAQDFPHSFFQLAYLMTRPPHRLVYAYDELQNLGSYAMAPVQELFGKDSQGHANVAELRNEEGEPRQDIMLRTCYRNTPYALAVAHALGFGVYRKKSEGKSQLVQFFDDDNLWKTIGYDVVDGELKAGEPVRLHRGADSAPDYLKELIAPREAVFCKQFDDQHIQAKWVADSIKNDIEVEELRLIDILVILPDALSVKDDARPLVQALYELGIDAHIAGLTSSVDELFSEDSVAITGIYRAKGNEAAVVYLLNAQYGHSGYELIRRRNTLFTAITRSRGWVRICGWGDEMRALAQEVEQVQVRDYVLDFKVPTEAERKYLLNINRDRSPEEKRKAKSREMTLEDLIIALEQGDEDIDNLPKGLTDRLRRQLGE